VRDYPWKQGGPGSLPKLHLLVEDVFDINALVFIQKQLLLFEMVLDILFMQR
jgi:hypothetical protein